MSLQTSQQQMAQTQANLPPSYQLRMLRSSCNCTRTRTHNSGVCLARYCRWCIRCAPCDCSGICSTRRVLKDTMAAHRLPLQSASTRQNKELRPWRPRHHTIAAPRDDNRRAGTVAAWVDGWIRCRSWTATRWPLNNAKASSKRVDPASRTVSITAVPGGSCPANKLGHAQHQTTP